MQLNNETKLHGVVVSEGIFLYRDDSGKKHRTLSFLACNDGQHEPLVILVPLWFYERNSYLFKPGRGISIKVIRDGKRAFVTDAWLSLSAHIAA